MAEKNDIKELKEMIKAAVVTGVFVGSLFKKGFKFSSLYKIPAWVMENREMLTEGFKGYKDIPSEIKDISKAEGIELTEYMLQDVIPIILKDIKG